LGKKSDKIIVYVTMDFYKKYGSSDSRRDELIKKIEAAVNNLTLEELEALHYDMMTKNYGDI
jgi:phosphopantetheine adenylyltransferase